MGSGKRHKNEVSATFNSFSDLAGRLSPARAMRAWRRAWYRSAIYHGLLCWQPETGLRQILPTRPAENLAAAQAVLDGRLLLAGKTLPFGTMPWSVPPSGPAAAEAMHGFSWLMDLKALGTEAARTRARDLLRGWIRANPRWNEQAWQPGVLGRRLVAWLACADFALDDGDLALRDAFFRSANMQARHLLRGSVHETGTAAAFAAIRGRMAAALCLGIGTLDSALGLLEGEIDHQILDDGCHSQRNPQVHLAVLRDLLDIRTIIVDAEAEIPLPLTGAIERMVAIARFFRHGDGGFTLANGGKEEDVHVIDTTLAEAGVKDRPPASAPFGGFERLVAGQVLIIIDAGGAPPSGADRLYHAAPAAFEMSVGRERLIVNCGGYAGDDPHWQAAMRSTAAHSTLMIDNINAVALNADGGVQGRRPDAGAVRREADLAIWLEVDHDGYRGRLGTICRRRLYVDAMGEDIRGEDVFEGRGGATFVVRFHLHPDVKAVAEAEHEGGPGGIRLTLPSGAAYRFISVGGAVALEDSVYLGISDVSARTRQIVVRGPFSDKLTKVKWALRRIGDGPGAEQEAKSKTRSEAASGDRIDPGETKAKDQAPRPDGHAVAVDEPTVERLGGDTDAHTAQTKSILVSTEMNL